jgi:DNA adenine methylase
MCPTVASSTRRSFYPETLRNTHRSLAGVDISSHDFEASAERARSDDFVYLDPPYASGLRGGRDSMRYHAAGFSEVDQRRLADIVRQLDRRGCLLMMSNPDSAATRELYRRFRIDSFSVGRYIGGHAGQRGMAGEIAVRND